MKRYFLKRLLFIHVTLFGIMLLNFVFVQMAPGGPIEQVLLKYENPDKGGIGLGRISGGGGTESMGGGGSAQYRGAQGLDPGFIKDLERQFGFDQPPSVRFFKMIGNYLVFDLGESFYRSEKVMNLILQKMPVSISLGLWSTLLIYLVSIPLGIKKAVKDGSKFDFLTSTLIIALYAIPAFLLAIFLIVVFCGGSYFNLFPLRGLTSDNFASLSWIGKVLDYLWHICLPVLCMTIGGFASLTMLTKNSFLEELSKLYVLTARAKGLSEKAILYRHVFRNAMLIVIAGFPSTLIGMLFASSLLIEVVFSLDGLGLLGYDAILNRDYPVIFGSLYIFSLLGLFLNLVSDLTYHLVDPRIDFEAKYA